jgi:hypothetical protein
MNRQSHPQVFQLIIWLCQISADHNLHGVELGPYLFLLLPLLGDYLIHCIDVRPQQPTLQVL